MCFEWPEEEAEDVQRSAKRKRLQAPALRSEEKDSSEMTANASGLLAI